MNLTELSYIIFKHDYIDIPCVGFNRLNTKGFIDDGTGWNDEDRNEFYDFISTLEDVIDTTEIGSFTYEVDDLVEFEKKMAELGIVQQEQGWTE